MPPRIPGLTDWRPLARGGFATVWEARQESLNRLVAVKVDQRTLDAEAERRRFLREAGAAGRMSGHPGIVTVHDAGILTDNRPYLVMELCPAGSLTRWLTADPRPSQDQVRAIGVRIADALAAAHEAGVLHRDVKPANILIDAYGHAGLADFGLAALPDPDSDLAETLEALTPTYAPPEVFRQERVSTAGDVWSLAATLYALLAGRPPRYPDNGPADLATMLELQGHPIKPIPRVDAGLMDLLLAALADDPAVRPTAAELRDRLAALPGLEPAPSSDATGSVAGRPTGLGSSARQRAPRPAGAVRLRGRAPAVLAAVVLLVLGAVAVGAVWAPWRSEADRVLASGSRPGISTSSSAGGSSPKSSAAGATGRSAAGSTTNGSAAGATASGSAAGPSDTPAAPTGFVPCTGGRGTTYCPTRPECWGGVISAVDSPYRGTPARCSENHVYQTFLAGRLSYDVRRQSQLDQDSVVRANCRLRLANAALPPASRRGDWEILALPPQGESDRDNVYRCIFGRGERSSALPVSPLE